MKIVQAVLRKVNGNETLTTWLDKRDGLKMGAVISLKDYEPNVLWQVQHLYTDEHEKSDFDFHRAWDNNNYDKHKGLDVHANRGKK